jgi:hypothetical protein
MGSFISIQALISVQALTLGAGAVEDGDASAAPPTAALMLCRLLP